MFTSWSVQEVGQLKADFQSRAAKDSEHDTIASQLRAELASERSNSDALRQKVQQLEAAVEQVKTDMACFLHWASLAHAVFFTCK